MRPRRPGSSHSHGPASVARCSLPISLALALAAPPVAAQQPTPTAPTAPTVPLQQEPAPLIMGPGRPRLHIDTTASRPVRLFEISAQPINSPNIPWGSFSQNPQPVARPVCRAPCDRVIDGSYGQSFYFGGNGVTPSRRFTLDEHDGPMLARVRPGRPGVFVGGVLLTSMSVAPLLTGTLFLALTSHAQRSADTTRNAGVALSAVGVSMLLSGILTVAFGRTRWELYRRYTGAAQRRYTGAAQRRPALARR